MKQILSIESSELATLMRGGLITLRMGDLELSLMLDPEAKPKPTRRPAAPGSPSSNGHKPKRRIFTDKQKRSIINELLTDTWRAVATKHRISEGTLVAWRRELGK